MEKVKWEIAREFERDGLVVQVSKLPLRRPKFSWMLGVRAKVKDGEAPRLSPHVHFNGGEDQEAQQLDTARSLVTDAMAWIRSEVAAAEARHAAWAAERDGHRDGGNGHSGPMRKGKTARDRERRHNRGRSEVRR